jgi:DNA-binding transcriptional MerR regulator
MEQIIAYSGGKEQPKIPAGAKKIFCIFNGKTLDLPPTGRCIIASETEVKRMKINEVEALVGITRKNIRFYESEGLLTPRRNSENGYRDYGEGDVAVLRQIKLMRKLGVSLEEIRQMQSGTHTVGDGMRRHLISLERDRRNLEESIALCTRLTDCQERLIDLDAEAVLTEMTALEQSGTTFQDKQRRDVGIRYVAPVAITLATVLLMGGFAALILLVMASDAEIPPLVTACILAVPLIVIAGVVYALVQRIQEIGKGEEDDAKDY